MSTTELAIQHVDKEALSKDSIKLEWLWKKVSEQDYAFDDFVRGNPAFFLDMLARETTEAYWIGEDGIVLVTDIYRKVSASVHLLMWNDKKPQQYFSEAQSLFSELFELYELVRLSAYLPGVVRPSIKRLVTLLGFRFEGALRKAFFWKGSYYDMEIYGLLKDQFEERTRVH